jgi:hypothetical protein
MDEESEIKLVNRAVVVLRPRAPYVAWANGFEGPKLAEDEYGRMASVFLVPEGGTDEETLAYVRAHCRFMFEHELAAWMTDEGMWPADRTWEAFQAWFDVEIHDVVVDLGRDPLAVATV